MAKLFETLGAGLVDTDEIAHELTAAGSARGRADPRQFGQEYVDAEGALDRARMRALVFSDAQREARPGGDTASPDPARSEARVESSTAPYVLLVVPLLVETGSYRELVRRVLVVDCDEELRSPRVMRRGGLSEEQVRAIMRARRPGRARCARPTT